MPFSLPALGTVYNPKQGLEVMESAFAPNEELTYLQCPQYASQLMTGFLEVLGDQHLQDVTLECCDGHSVRSSKIFLAACSPYFRQVLTQHESKLYLTGITLEVMEILVVFMSQGNIDVSSRLLLDVIDAATTLQIQGFQTALTQYLTPNNKHIDSQFEEIRLSIPTSSVDATSTFTDYLLGVTPLVTSTLENQPNTESDVEFQKPKEGNCSPQANLFESKKSRKTPGRPRKSEEPEKDLGHPKISEKHIHLSNLHDIPIETGKSNSIETMKNNTSPGRLMLSEILELSNKSNAKTENSQKVRGRPRKLEERRPSSFSNDVSFEAENAKRGEGQPEKIKSAKHELPIKYPGCFVKLKELKNNSGHASESEKQRPPSNLNKIFFETEKSKRGLNYLKTKSEDINPPECLYDVSFEPEKPKRGRPKTNKQVDSPQNTESVNNRKSKKNRGRPRNLEELRPNNLHDVSFEPEKTKRGRPKTIKRVDSPQNTESVGAEISKKFRGSPWKLEEFRPPNNLHDVSVEPEQRKRGRPKTNKRVDSPQNTVSVNTEISNQFRGSPRKLEEFKPPNNLHYVSYEPEKPKRGRPKTIKRDCSPQNTVSVDTKISKKIRGRPRKIEEFRPTNNLHDVSFEPDKPKRGRPKIIKRVDSPQSTESVNTNISKKFRGRPRKLEEFRPSNLQDVSFKPEKPKRGRPKTIKRVDSPKNTKSVDTEIFKKVRGRPRKLEEPRPNNLNDVSFRPEKPKRGRPKTFRRICSPGKSEFSISVNTEKTKKSRGRPKKSDWNISQICN